MEDNCQSCGRAPVEIVNESEDPADPYRICRNCHRRLLSHTLRPREWYNLVAIHGHLDLLGEDYYSQEDGAALQPAEAVINAASFPCPNFQEEKSSPDRLLTYILSRNQRHEDEITEGHLYQDLISAMQSYSPDVLLPAYVDRLNRTKSHEILGTIFHLIGLTLEDRGATIVRENWDKFVFTGIFMDVAFAASKCLPLQEAHQKVTDALSRMDAERRSGASFVLHYFETELNLDWIEGNATSPVWSTWGGLAASSRFDWERAKKWLSAGRPLSLIALDALHRCLCSSGKPALMNPPGSKEFVSTLQDYLSRDNVPRTRETVSDLLKYAGLL